VEFTPPGRGGFSLAETAISLPSEDKGLQLKLSTSGATMPSFWRFAMTADADSSTRRRRKVRFIAPIEVASDGVTRDVFVPWTSFKGQMLRVGGVDQCGASEECQFKPEKMTHLSILWSRKSGIEEPTLILHGMQATQTMPLIPLPPIVLGKKSCSCDADCVRCMASEWAPLISQSCDSSTTADMCLSVRTSFAEHIIAGLGGRDGTCSIARSAEVKQWLASAIDVTACMTGSSPSLPAKLLGDVLQAVLSTGLPELKTQCSGSGTSSVAMVGDFLGPFVGSGITGWNDLGVTEGETASRCLEKCRADSRCKSIDYGARDQVQGECWLSTADRYSAPGAFSTKWYLYDYYELASVSAGMQTQSTGSQMKALSSEKQETLLRGQKSDQECCADPEACMNQAIEAGAPTYNSGDHLGCAFIYHSIAKKLAACPATPKKPSVRGMFAATTEMSEEDTQPGNAAWRLRIAFDSYITMLRNSEADKCVGRAEVQSSSGAAVALKMSEKGNSTPDKVQQTQNEAQDGVSGGSTDGDDNQEDEEREGVSRPNISGTWQGGVLLLLPSILSIFLD